MILPVRLSSSLAFCRRLFAGAVLGQAAVVLSLGGNPGARPAFLLFVASWSALLIFIHGRQGWSSRPSIRKTGPILGRLELAAFNVALTLVLAETSLRLYAAVSGDHLMIRETLDAYRLVRGRDYGNGLRGNQLGYPGPDFRVDKAPGICRIAALGDSFAVGPAVPFADNYLSRLEKILPNAEVYNFGVSGAGPREYWTILNEHVWTYRPDLVLVSVFVGNDITEWLATPRHMNPRQYATYLLLARGSRVLLERRRLGENADPVADGATGSASYPTIAAGLSQDRFDEVEARRLEVCLKATRPDLERKWQRALGYLEAIIRGCREREVPVLLVLIPDEFQMNPQVLTRALQKAGRSPNEIDLDLPQRRFQEFCRRFAAPCLDLLPAFARTPETYAPRDTHWNVRGNHLAAQEIAAWLAHRNGSLSQ